MTNISSVILGWISPLKEIFPRILRQYCPPPAVVVDPCSGYKEFYKNLVGIQKRIQNTQADLKGNEYKFIFGDIRDLPGNDFTADITKKLPLADEIADVVVFDPPYGSGHHMFSPGNARAVELYTEISLEDIPKLLSAAYPEIHRILKPGGILIFKIQDRHYKKKFYPLHITAVEIFKNLEFYDLIIFRGIMRHRMANLANVPYANKKHSYFMIFKKGGKDE